MIECEEYKATTLRNMINAFNEGWNLGVEYHNSLYKSNKINVEYDDKTEELEFMRLSDGTIHSYGRSIPF
jgi:hypothetical protein